jgi:multidrug resistance protein, MATE family
MKYPAKITKLYLLKLSIPIFFSNLAIPLVGVVDTSLMGHLSSSSYLAATSIATSIMTMILWSFGFLRMGTVGLVAQSLGKGDYREIALITLRNISIACAISILVILMKYPILIMIENYFNMSKETFDLIKKYISVRILSAPAELVIYVFVGLYLGLQKTKISSVLIIFYSVLNILLSIYFVKNLDLEIYGVALGTVLSSYVTLFIFTLFTYFYFKNKFNIIPRYRKVFVFKKLLKLLSINFDLFIRTVLLTFAFLWITYQSSKLGEDYLAANTILLQFIVISAFFLDAYAFSTEGVVGYSLGRKIKKSFLSVVSSSFQLSFYTSLIISLIYLLFYKNIINVLTDLDYIKFIAYGFIFWVIIIPPFASLSYQFDGIFIGTSQTAEIRNSMIISVILYIIISIYLINLFYNNGIWLSLLVLMILRSLTLNLYFFRILRKF